MENYSNFCAFTGHRDVEEGEVDEELVEKCILNLIERGTRGFFCGMARGFDLIAGKVVLKIKERLPEIKLIACIPCPGQNKYFSEEAKRDYENVLSRCDETIVISPVYNKGCMYKRNRFMVDNSDRILAFLREKNGGTFYTVCYAKSQQKEIVVI